MSLFITFEGGEGCGKSTQSGILYRRLKKSGYPVLLTHEPGITALGKKITALLKWSKNISITPLAELLLFNVSRAQLVADVLKPALKNGLTVICDRYSDSTIAYQGYGRGLDLEIVKTANALGTQGLAPVLTILLDITPEVGLIRNKNKKHDRFEAQELNFHRRVRRGYLALAKEGPGRWLVLDAARSKNEIALEIWQKVSRLLPRQ
jgi:dTMP kinase